MKIFFSASISRSKKLLPIDQSIVAMIEELGHEVVNKAMVETAYSSDPHWDKKYDAVKLYQEELTRMESADALITECTTPSFGAAFFIDRCVQLKKPLLSLHYGFDYQNEAPLMLRGRQGINLHLYTEETLHQILKEFLVSLKEH